MTFWNFAWSKYWWWWWIVFVVWLTDERRLALFPAGTTFRDPHHRESMMCCKQGLTFCTPVWKIIIFWEGSKKIVLFIFSLLKIFQTFCSTSHSSKPAKSKAPSLYCSQPFEEKPSTISKSSYSATGLSNAF